MNDVKILGEFYFSQMLGKPIYNAAGERIGCIKDMAVRWESHYPRIVGIKYASKVHKLIPCEWINAYGKRGLELTAGFTLQHTVALQDEDIYISKWLLDKQIIDLQGYKLVRVNDITLSWISEQRTSMVLTAVDIGIRGLFRRLGLEFLVKRAEPKLVGWQHIKPLDNWNSSLQLTMEKQQLKELHPADLADLLEELDYKSRARFIDHLDSQQTVEALAVMDLETQVEIINQMESERASDILEELPADEAADILSELSDERSQELLNLMESDDADDVRELMQHEEGTAGALMTTEYIAFASHLSAGQAIDKLRELAPAAETIYYIYVTDSTEHLEGVLSLRELIIASPDSLLVELMHKKVAAVTAADEFDRAAEIIGKYGLLALPVVDEDFVMQGIITVDDVLDMLLPERSKLDAYSLLAKGKKQKGALAG